MGVVVGQAGPIRLPLRRWLPWYTLIGQVVLLVAAGRWSVGLGSSVGVQLRLLLVRSCVVRRLALLLFLLLFGRRVRPVVRVVCLYRGVLIVELGAGVLDLLLQPVQVALPHVVTLVAPVLVWILVGLSQLMLLILHIEGGAAL